MEHTLPQAEIAKLLAPFGGEDERLERLLALSVGRVLANAARRGEEWRGLADPEKLRHAADWLRAALANDDPWLGNLDGKGRPKKLMKFRSVDDIVKEADKAMIKAAQRLSGVRLVEGDEELAAELEDGWSIIRLLTPSALDRESATMQHCIGNGGYDDLLGNEEFEFLSLRDPAGKPHATLEVANGCLTQLQGKQNNPPIPAYANRIAPFIQDRAIVVGIPARSLGYAVDVEGQWHDIHDLPDGLRIEDDLSLSGTQVAALPRNLTVGGSLYLRRTPVTELPDGLSVGGRLDLEDVRITSLPGDVRVAGTLDLRRSGVTELPEGLSVEGCLDLRGTSVAELPEGLKVGGDLFLNETRISLIPEDLAIGGDLYMLGTPATTLPNGLKIKGSLALGGSRIEKLPRGLEVGGYLDLSDTPIKSLPEDLKVGTFLDLSGTAVERLPDGFPDTIAVRTDDGEMTAGEFRRRTLVAAAPARP